MTAPQIPSEEGPALKNPWWIPPFLGRVPPGIEQRHLSLLGAVSAALIFEEYDLALLTSVLPFIAEHFQVAETALPAYLSVVRLGALPALLLIPFADRIGRRRAFLGSLTASALATVATGFAWNMDSYVALQMIVRMMFVVGASVAYVYVAEEFPAARRGWGMGVLAAVGAMGYGIEAGLFSQMDRLPYGWRALYWIGGAPLLLLPLFARVIPETERFERRAAAFDTATGATGWRRIVEPFQLLVADSWLRFVGVTLCMAGFGFAGVAAFQFTAYYTIKVLGWTKGEYATMFVVCGAFGIIGNVVAGRLGDRVGRRWVGIIFLAIFPIFITLFYRGPGWAVPVAWIGLVFSSSAARMLLRAFSTELFSTDRRATASGWVQIVDTLASAAGLAVLSAFSMVEGDVVRLIPVLGLTTVAAAAVMWFFPETRSRELDSI